MSSGLLLLRIALGGALVVQGAAKLTRGGRRGTAAFFADVGFVPALPLAVLAGLTEVVAGALLVAGLGTVLASAAAVGVLGTAAVVNSSNGYWNHVGGVEYPLVAALGSAALAFTGAGALSVDELIGWTTPSTSTAAGAAALGLVAAAPLLVRRARHLPRTPTDFAPLAAAHEAV
jgi:putative oxidoreductase